MQWENRLRNKTTITGLALTIIAMIYQILGLFGVVPPISQETAVEAVGLFINAFAILGIIVDPNTPGVTD